MRTPAVLPPPLLVAHLPGALLWVRDLNLGAPQMGAPNPTVG